MAVSFSSVKIARPYKLSCLVPEQEHLGRAGLEPRYLAPLASALTTQPMAVDFFSSGICFCRFGTNSSCHFPSYVHVIIVLKIALLRTSSKLKCQFAFACV